MTLMAATVPVTVSLSAEACAAMREAGRMDEQGNFVRTLVEQALAEGFIWRMAGLTGAAVKVLTAWLDRVAGGGDA
jgi:hypothetical protein